jgi:predicted Rossmann fold flavoprotein
LDFPCLFLRDLVIIMGVMLDVDVLVVGAGPAGVFAAVCAVASRPGLRVVILEAGAEPLRKVRISGGGRCNVTNACWDLRELAGRYPRGSKELLGPFHRFGPAEMLDWLDQHGVATKEEDHGRMFPSTDDSGTIIEALLQACESLSIGLHLRTPVRAVTYVEQGWQVETDHEVWTAPRVVLATGSSRTGWQVAEQLGITIKPSVPSLFTFKIATHSLHRYSGVSVPNAQVTVVLADGQRFESQGALLVTHWGLSGPAVLWCSAMAARALALAHYQARVEVQWDRSVDQADLSTWLDARRQQAGKKKLRNDKPEHLPKRLWHWALGRAECPAEATWAGLTTVQRQRLAEAAAVPSLPMDGQSVHKEEFVTAGGIILSEIDFRRMSVKKHPGLFAVGEMLDIDAMTGGYNFQACWTGGWICGRPLQKKPLEVRRVSGEVTLLSNMSLLPVAFTCHD